MLKRASESATPVTTDSGASGRSTIAICDHAFDTPSPVSTGGVASRIMTWTRDA
jgi:hypothetical protein